MDNEPNKKPRGAIQSMGATKAGLLPECITIGVMASKARSRLATWATLDDLVAGFDSFPFHRELSPRGPVVGSGPLDGGEYEKTIIY
jgi:hypothetical protein